MNNLIKIIFLLILLPNFFFSQKKLLHQSLNNSSAFIENKGQWNRGVVFLSKEDGRDNWILKDGSFLINLYQPFKFQNNASNLFNKYKLIHDSIRGHRINFCWLNSNPNITFFKNKKHHEYYNYFIGNNPNQHQSQVCAYDELVAKELYKGIDIRFYHEKGILRYDLILNPYQDINQIKLKIKGSDSLKIDSLGNVIVNTNIGLIKMQELYVYENETKKQIQCNWVINAKQELSLIVGKYDKSKTLIIDPLIYSTFLGGTNYEYSNDIVVNEIGESFITGATQSLDFDNTLGAYQISSNGIWDGYISKLNANGTALVFSTYFGGSSAEHSRSIKVDNLGNSYVTGYTNSSDFYTTTGAFQAMQGSSLDGDVFVTKLNSTGTGILYSTYIGGTEDDQGFAIDIDSQNNAYVTGWTASTNYDVTPGVFQPVITSGALYDVFVTKINSTGSALIYSTYLGGSNQDCGLDICVDSLNFVYVTGYTNSLDFDTSAGAYQTVLIGSSTNDAFITKINPFGTGIVYSTFLGGLNSDGARAIEVDKLGNSYLTGFTFSNNFPVSTNAFQNSQADSGNYSDCFFTKLNSTGTGILYSTYLGSLSTDDANDIVIDSVGNIYISGWSYSQSFYTTTDAYQSFNASPSDRDVIISKFSNNGAMLYSTYIGGVGDDYASGIAIDKTGRLYVTGATNSVNYPITNGCYQNTISSNNYDGFVTKLGICSPINFSLTTTNVSCYGNNDGIAEIHNGNTQGYSYGWTPSNYSTLIIDSLLPGIYGAYIQDTLGCVTSKTFTITQPSPVVASVIGIDTICFGSNLVLTANGGTNYLWSNGSTSNTVSVSPTLNTTYTLVASVNSCSDTAEIIIHVLPKPDLVINGNDSICLGQFSILTTTTTTISSYNWSTGANTNSIIVTPTINTIYTLIASNGSCSDTVDKQVYINPIVNSSIVGTSSLCIGASVLLQALGGDTYNWGFGATTSTLSVSPTVTTTYSVIASNSYGCSDTAMKTINVVPLPISLIIGDTTICTGENLILSANGIGDFLWSTSEITSSIVVSPTINTSFQLVASNSCGNATDSILVLVKPLPMVVASNDTTILINNSVVILINGGLNNSYSWFPTDVSCVTCSINIVSPNVTTIYTVIVTNADGCSLKKEIKVSVESDFSVFIPDVFSPNGDGENDILYVRGIGIDNINFKFTTD